MRKNKVEIVMDQLFQEVKENNKVKVVKEDGSEPTLLDKLSNTYPRPTTTLIGKINCVENGLIYITSNTMKVLDMTKSYEYIIKNIKYVLRHTHHVKHYGMLELMLITDSILRSKNLVYEILKSEIFENIKNIELAPMVAIKSGIIKSIEPYKRRKSYAIGVKRVIWEIREVFEELEKALKEDGNIGDDEKLDPATIKNYNSEDYKVFKNEIKSRIADFIVNKTGEDANLMEGVRGAQPLLAKDLKDVWLR
jgi:hypothetical protein